MSDIIMLKTQSYCLAVREQLGYPLFAPVNHTLAFASGGPAIGHKLLDLARHATTMGRDMVYIAWPEFSRAEPAEIVLAMRELTHVDVITGCQLWATDATAPLVIVAPRRDEHFVLSGRGYLERRRGMPAKHLGRGRRIARQRVTRAAALQGTELLPDNQLVPPGGEWVPPAPASDSPMVRVA